jgi:putative inorganic carbon (HCO3(-)) transporter
LQDFGFTGIGFGTFGTASQTLYPYGTLQGVDFHHAHNLYLQLGSDLGLPGIVAYTAVWIGAFAIVLQILSTPGLRASRRGQVIGAAGAGVALLANGLIDIALWGVKASFLPWMVLAFVAGSSVYAREASRRT